MTHYMNLWDVLDLLLLMTSFGPGFRPHPHDGKIILPRTVEEAIQLSYDIGANHKKGTDFAIYAPAFAEKFRLSYRPTDDLEEVKACLRTGGAAIALVKNREDYVSVFTRKEHYVTLISVDEKDIFTVLDPNQYEGKFDEEGRAGRVSVDGHFIYCTGELLTEETGGRPATRYHLFQRQEKT